MASIVEFAEGLQWPFGQDYGIAGSALILSVINTLNAASTRAAQMGQVQIPGHLTSKTISAAGGGKIWFRIGSTLTFASGSTSITIGLQDWSTTSGPPSVPDGVFDVSATVVGGGGGLAAGWNSITMTSGSKTLSHGDPIAVVHDMTARGGSDSVQVGGGGNRTRWPDNSARFTGGTWQSIFVDCNCVIQFDDGTLGIIGKWNLPIIAASGDNFNTSSSPDENGMLFQVPFDCEFDAIYCTISQTSAGNLVWGVYSNPLGSPSLLSGGSYTWDGNQAANASGTDAFGCFFLPAPVALSKNTDYAVTANTSGGTGGVRLCYIQLADTAYRAFIQGGTTIKKVSRNNGSGSFSAESPAITIYQMGIRICGLVDTATAAGGGSPIFGASTILR